MTTLADLVVSQEFLFACQVTAVDGVTGISLALFGPGSVQAASAAISPVGVLTGQLSAPANQVPVTVVTGFAPVSVGDLLENQVTGETMVARWSQINPDGTVIWSAAVTHEVTYPATGWLVVAHYSGVL